MTGVASPIPLPAAAGEWRERGRRDIDHVTRGARVREWATNESMQSGLRTGDDDDLVFVTSDSISIFLVTIVSFAPLLT